MDKALLISRARVLLTEQPQSVRYDNTTIERAIPSAIADLQAEIQGQPAKWIDFTVETGDISIIDNVADISTEANGNGLLLSKIKNSTIIVSYVESPTMQTVQWVNSMDRLTLGGIADDYFIKAFINGSAITFKHPKEDPWNSTFKIKSAAIPSDLSVLPASLVGDVARSLVRVLKFTLAPNEPGMSIQAQRSNM